MNCLKQKFISRTSIIIQNPKQLHHLCTRFIGPYRNYRYGGKSFNHNRLVESGILNDEPRVRGQVAFWNALDKHGIIIDDLTGEQYSFDFNDILGKNEKQRKLLVYRNVEFTPVRKSNFELIATDVIDLGPSAYMPPSGVTERIRYPTVHLKKRGQFEGIPYWYQNVIKSFAPLCELPRVKPTMYKDGNKLHGKKY